MTRVEQRAVRFTRHVAVLVAIGCMCRSTPAYAAKDEAARDYLLALGGHALITSSEICDQDLDVVGCTTGWLAAGLDLGVLRYTEPALALGARFAMTTGLDASGFGSQPHRQWLLRLMAEARVEDGGAESGWSLGFAAGAALLLDRIVTNVGGGRGSSSMLQDQKATDAGPAIGMSAEYDFLVYDHLLLGLVLRAELMYLLGINSIDLGGGTKSFSAGLTPLVELGMRMSMSQ